MRSFGASLVLSALLLLLVVPAPPAQAQTWGTVEGRVTEAGSDAPLPGVTIVVQGTNYGTASGTDGRYTLRLPTGRHLVRFSAVGFEPRVDSVVVRKEEPTRLDVALRATVLEMDGVTVEDDRPQEAGVYEVDPTDVQNIPTPFKDGFRALKVMPGVATNNELTQQYSVRGGGYNENLVFINGFEVFMPFRPRQGEQEGLGLLNPDLAKNITFYTGGFPARYGGKLSSALDVSYATPTDSGVEGEASLSTLDASVHAQSSALDGKLGWNVGVRRAQPGRFFGTQDLKGDYDPRFTDVQGLVSYRFNDAVRLEALGIFADHTFELEPTERKTYFGLISLDPSVPSDFNVLWSNLNGARQDGYTTGFGGLRLETEVTDRLRLEHDVAYFQTKETENFDINGSARVFTVDPSKGEDTPDAYTQLSGQSEHINFADNAVTVDRLTGRGRYRYTLNRHALEAGWHVRSLHFNDRINEKSVIETPDLSSDGARERIVVDSLRDRASYDEMQTGLYLQDAVDVLPERDRLIVTGGVRADYFSFNDEWTLSPRLSTRLKVNDRLTLTGSWGLYHQKPTYRELRGTLNGEQGINDALNRTVQSQELMQTVLGGEYFFPDRRLYLRVEGYYKDIDNVISYTIEDIRVNYSGFNDARAHIYGVDLQLRGEFVPGLESWFNYSYMVARERFYDSFQDQYNRGLIPRPTDQRHTFSAFVQDYVPGDKTWKLHMRMLYGSGLPYTPPINGPENAEGVRVRKPGPRMSGRLPAYRRVDIGATKEIEVAGAEGGSGSTPVKLNLTLEVLNLFDMDNTVAYTWEGDWSRVPKRLTPRTLNARVRLTF